MSDDVIPFPYIGYVPCYLGIVRDQNDESFQTTIALQKIIKN